MSLETVKKDKSYFVTIHITEPFRVWFGQDRDPTLDRKINGTGLRSSILDLYDRAEYSFHEDDPDSMKNLEDLEKLFLEYKNWHHNSHNSCVPMAAYRVVPEDRYKFEFWLEDKFLSWIDDKESNGVTWFVIRKSDPRYSATIIHKDSETCVYLLTESPKPPVCGAAMQFTANLNSEPKIRVLEGLKLDTVESLKKSLTELKKKFLEAIGSRIPDLSQMTPI